MEYSTILIIDIGFGKNILKIKKDQISEHTSLSSGNPIPLTKETQKREKAQ